MLVSIVIPTLKTPDGIVGQLNEIRSKKTNFEYELFAGSHTPLSAAGNRNWCLDRSKGDIVIMMDDDMKGFYDNWVDDLITPLIEGKDKYNIMSARLLQKNGQVGPQLGNNGKYEAHGDMEVAIHCEATGLNIVGSACISFFREDGIRFDEHYRGSTYEDTDFCMEYNKQFPNRKVFINNKCRIIHLGEGKGRGSKRGLRDNWKFNKEYFANKWKVTV